MFNLLLILTISHISSNGELIQTSLPKSWIRAEPHPFGTRDGDLQDITCGTHPVNPTVRYRIQIPVQQIQLPYPTYPNKLDCSWNFYGEGCFPVISCEAFQLPESGSCSGTHLEITDGYSVSKKYCGSSGPINTTTNSTVLISKFAPTISIPTRGFTCIITCVSNITSENVITNALPPPATANCTCGIPGALEENQGAHRVVGGKDAAPHYWKWQVGLSPKTRQAPICGAALINDRFVLTAAHCVVTTGLLAFPRAADVILNAYNMKNKSEQIRRSVIAINSHPFYDPVGQDYDFALIEFDEPVDLLALNEPTVKTVCLPPKGTKDLFVGSIGTVTGWGVTKEGGNQSMILQEADIPIITNEDCNQQYGSGKGRIKITDRMLCASYPEGGIDSCQGDSGGPFVLKQDNGRYMEIGVVSFGEGCARKGKPGVYSRVTAVNDWIRLIAREGIWCNE